MSENILPSGFECSSKPDILPKWRGIGHTVTWRRTLSPAVIAAVDDLVKESDRGFNRNGKPVLAGLNEWPLGFKLSATRRIKFHQYQYANSQIQDRFRLPNPFTLKDLFPGERYEPLTSDIHHCLSTILETVFPFERSFQLFFMTSVKTHVPYHLHEERFVGLNYGPTTTEVVNNCVNNGSYKLHKPAGKDVEIKRGDIVITGHSHRSPQPSRNSPHHRLWMGLRCSAEA